MWISSDLQKIPQLAYFLEFLLIFILLEQQITHQMRNVFVGRAPIYVCDFFRPTICPSVCLFVLLPIMWSQDRSYIFLINTFLLNWQISFFLPIGGKSTNQITGGIWQVSYNLSINFLKKFWISTILKSF